VPLFKIKVACVAISIDVAVAYVSPYYGLSNTSLRSSSDNQSSRG